MDFVAEVGNVDWVNLGVVGHNVMNKGARVSEYNWFKDRISNNEVDSNLKHYKFSSVGNRI